MSAIKDIFSKSLIARDLMTKIKVILKQDAPVLEFINSIVKKNVEFVVIVDDKKKVVGTATEENLTKLIKIQPMASMEAVISQDIPKSALEEPVSKIMTVRPMLVKDIASVGDVINLMIAQNLRYVIVVDDEGKAIGVIRLKDIFKKFIE
jgi:predicted transcriptional regulator